MAAVTRGNSEDVRRAALSPRSKGRENAKDTLCRNVTIYGHCRYEDKGCTFSHEPIKVHAQPGQPDSIKKRLNVDSPTFTPASASTLAVNGSAAKSLGLSPKAASAAPFKPKGPSSNTSSFVNSLSVEPGSFHKKSYNPAAPDWALGQSSDLPDFLPQSHSVTPSIPSKMKNDKPSKVKDNKPSEMKENKPSKVKGNKPSEMKDNKPSRVRNNKLSKVKGNKSSKMKENTQISPDKPQSEFSQLSQELSTPTNSQEMPTATASQEMSTPTENQETSTPAENQETSTPVENKVAVPHAPLHGSSDPFLPGWHHSIRPYASDSILQGQHMAHPGLPQNSFSNGPQSSASLYTPSYGQGPFLHPNSIPPRRQSLIQGGFQKGNPLLPQGNYQSPGPVPPNFNLQQSPGYFPNSKEGTDYHDNHRSTQNQVPSGPPNNHPWPNKRELSGEAKPFVPQGPALPAQGSNTAGIPSDSTTPFTQRGVHTPAFFHQFQNYNMSPVSHFSYQGETNGGLSQSMYDPYVSPTPPLSAVAQGPHPPQSNPYAQDSTTTGGASYYQNNAYTQPILYHLYTSLAPHRENLLPYQRTAHDFFISDSLREDLQRKSAATLQILPNSTLPVQIEHFHSLVPLDTSNQRNAALFGYPSWIYKAVSHKDGHTYALRRLEGYHLTNEKAFSSVQAWKRVISGNVVTVHNAFTNPAFGERSLIFVTDYHPLSRTLAEVHFAPSSRGFPRNQNVSQVTEQVLWGYIAQIANALKTIHAAGLAARIINPSKILLTGKNRIRLNGCAILDIVQYDASRNLIDLQREDLVQFGRLILAIGTNNPSVTNNITKAMEQFSRSYPPHLKNRVFWLINQATSENPESIDTFLAGLTTQLLHVFDNSLHEADELTSELNRELENSRLVRLMTKINFITERPEYGHDRQWSETGERYPIKLFRDYVFHQVDAQGAPVLDLAHVLSCLNKLDAGSEEKIMLTTRDDQICILVSFKQMKRAIASAFQDLVKASRSG